MDATHFEVTCNITGKMVGLNICRVIAGGSAGSIIGIEIGRLDSINDSWYVGVECTWRLDSCSAPLTSSEDDNSQNGPMLKFLQTLVGLEIMAVDVIPPAFDLIFTTTNGKRLRVFCDRLRNDCCWYVLGPHEEQISVEPAGTIKIGSVG